MNEKNMGFCKDTPLVGDHINPFTHRLELTSAYEKIRTAIFTVAVLPLRVAAICGFLVIAWIIASIGLYGLSEEDLRTKPMTGWRKKVREILGIVGQLTYRIGGMNITIKGRQAPRQAAPILVVAPHSTFLDIVVIYVTGFPSIVARWESGGNPWLGKLINYSQPVYVMRQDSASRQNAIREIIRRANSDLDYPQVLIFPEGTCTNRSCLITFKCGAFCPGVPVQPICIRYPNKVDTVTWTWEGPGALKLLWRTLTQVHNNCEIEFLPVYYPSPEEKADPKLFANNVRKVMADALGVPVTNFTYDHCRLIKAAQKLRLPLRGSLVEMQRLRQCLDLEKTKTDEHFLTRPMEKDFVNRQEFAKRLQADYESPVLGQLFDLCDIHSDGRLDWNEYLLSVLVISTNGNLIRIVQQLFVMMSPYADGSLPKDVFKEMASRALSWPTEKSSSVFKTVTSSSKTPNITFEQFVDYVEKCDDFDT